MRAFDSRSRSTSRGPSPRGTRCHCLSCDDTPDPGLVAHELAYVVVETVCSLETNPVTVSSSVTTAMGRSPLPVRTTAETAIGSCACGPSAKAKPGNLSTIISQNSPFTLSSGPASLRSRCLLRRTPLLWAAVIVIGIIRRVFTDEAHTPAPTPSLTRAETDAIAVS